MRLYVISIIALMISSSVYAQVNFNNLTKESNYQSENTSLMKVSANMPDRPACGEFLDYAQNEMNTSGLIVIKDGEALLELYGKEFDPTSKVKVWSITKYLSGLMLGTQVKK